MKKLLWKLRNRWHRDIISEIHALKELLSLPTPTTRDISDTEIVIRKMGYLHRKREDYVAGLDYVRHSSLELVSKEIYRNNLQGNVAELGVYKGNFAEKINKAFPDRKLYLFDTFEGFAERDRQFDLEKNYLNITQDFSDTSINIVMKKMKYKENCIIKKGYFPDSALGTDDTFVFVSIDADLFNPIYEGLCWFYPKMCGGGVIFVHDYNNRCYDGAKEAIIKFCDENNINFFPLSDSAGTAVIIKDRKAL